MTTPISASPTNLGRAFDLYRRTAGERSAVALVLANAIPLIGVLFFGWSLWTILVIFWLENGIVGLWNIPRILMARGSMAQALQDMSEEAAFNATGNARAAAELRSRWQAAQGLLAQQRSGGSGMVNPVGAFLLNAGSAGRALMAVWFLVHYGVFWLGHGVFVFALPNFAFTSGPVCLDSLPGGFPTDATLAPSCAASPFGEIVWSNVAFAGVALFLSHGASFFLNYIGKKEYLTTVAVRQAFAPYGRVVILHLTILFGAFIVAILGAPIGLLLLLVVLKTAFDLQLHLRANRTTAPEVPVVSATPS